MGISLEYHCSFRFRCGYFLGKHTGPQNPVWFILVFLSQIAMICHGIPIIRNISGIKESFTGIGRSESLDLRIQ